MRHWRTYLPTFTKRLWCQLAISYTLLACCAMTLMIVILYGKNDYQDFQQAITLDNIEQRVSSEALTLVQAVQTQHNAEWSTKALHNIRDKLLNLEIGSSTSIYRISNSSRPQVFIQLIDQNNGLISTYPNPFPANIALQFTTATQNTTPQDFQIRWLYEKGPIWVDKSLLNDQGQFIGRVRVLFIAKFNVWIQLQTIFSFLLNAGGAVILLAVPIGLICGYVAARYVTRQLHRMNTVTERWRQGNFEARIALPNDDVLTLHSQHLNDMAQDLELYLSLKQSISVTDERSRLARELHDTVKQKLFALGLQLATAKTKINKQDTAHEHILEAELITHEAQQDLMEIITQLRPDMMRLTSLAERMTLIAHNYQRRFNIKIHLEHINALEANAHIEHNLLRIVQEAIMNAVNHGHATHIDIVGSTTQTLATLTITDNGKGFETTKKYEGFGMSSMRDRTTSFPQGHFTLNSRAPVGTQIILNWKKSHES